LAEYRRKIGFIFQDYRLLPKLTVYENIAFAMEMICCQAKTIRREVPLVLSMVGLSDKAKYYPDELSGGEQQRVAIARAIINKPETVIADEPTGNLDLETSKEIMKILYEINRRGTTVIMATHDREIVNHFHRRVVELKNGIIIRDDQGTGDMTMNPKKISYIFKQAFKSMWRNRMMGAASIGSVTAVLIILGFVLIIVLNVNNMAMVAKETFDQIAVYIGEGVDDEQIEEMGRAFRQIDGVMAVAFQTKDYALESVKKDWGEDAILLQDLRHNPFPDTYIVQLSDVSKSDEVIAKLQTFEGVERVRYYQDAVNTLIKLSEFVKRFGAAIIIVLLLISVFIISNTIKITVLSRQREIELMQYIGATNGYVRGPFILEGIMLGLLGSVVAILLIMLGYNYTINYLAGRYVALISGMSGYLVGVEMVINDLIIIFMTIGIGIGILGSLVSLKKFLSI